MNLDLFDCCEHGEIEDTCQEGCDLLIYRLTGDRGKDDRVHNEWMQRNKDVKI